MRREELGEAPREADFFVHGSFLCGTHRLHDPLLDAYLNGIATAAERALLSWWTIEDSNFRLKMSDGLIELLKRELFKLSTGCH